MTIREYTQEQQLQPAPQVYLGSAQGPASLDQRKRAQERIDRIWYSPESYFVFHDDDLTLEDWRCRMKVLALRVQHYEVEDDRYTVYVSRVNGEFQYDCQAPCGFQRPVTAVVIGLVQASFDELGVSRMEWA